MDLGLWIEFLHLEEWIEYVQYAVAYLEARGCKHILLQGQGTYGDRKSVG